MDTLGFWCAQCNAFHEGIPMCYRSDAPYYYDVVAPEERELRCELNSELCVIDDEFFFINGSIEIPVKDLDDVFVWGVWVSLSKANFERAIDMWDSANRHKLLEPMFDWLSTSIPGYPETLNLKTMVHTQEVGLRPLIELEKTDHPLTLEQSEGITTERVVEIAELLGQIEHDKR